MDLFIEAKAYMQGRIPVPDKETAIAIFLSRDEALISRTLELVADYGLEARKSLGYRVVARIEILSTATSTAIASYVHLGAEVACRSPRL